MNRSSWVQARMPLRTRQLLGTLLWVVLFITIDLFTREHADARSAFAIIGIALFSRFVIDFFIDQE